MLSVASTVVKQNLRLKYTQSKIHKVFDIVTNLTEH